MKSVLFLTIKGIYRDKVLHGILCALSAFLVIPAVSSLSMRQVAEMAATLSLSLNSALLFLIAAFLGGSSLWRDMERRYVFSVLGLPISRSSYLLGKFLGNALFMLLLSALLGLLSCLVVHFATGMYTPDRPIVWGNLVTAIVFSALCYILLLAFAFLFSTVSTSSFLPLFGTIAVFLVGCASQNVYDYVNSPAGQGMPQAIKSLTRVLYYILPNFSSFDFKLNGIYGVPLNVNGLLLTFGYFIAYTGVLLAGACLIFARREMK